MTCRICQILRQKTVGPTKKAWYLFLDCVENVTIISFAERKEWIVTDWCTALCLNLVWEYYLLYFSISPFYASSYLHPVLDSIPSFYLTLYVNKSTLFICI